MIGLAFGSPVVTFEAVGDRLPASRLHLPQPPGMPVEKTGITHVYHTADPIPMGACTGTYSGCYAAGFVSIPSMPFTYAD
jgi:lipase ATG15